MSAGEEEGCTDSSMLLYLSLLRFQCCNANPMAVVDASYCIRGNGYSDRHNSLVQKFKKLLQVIRREIVTRGLPTAP
jgi:hypothetical protein